jgi:S1-C subfamily serine protease
MPLFVRDGVTYGPLKAINEAAGNEVKWQPGRIDLAPKLTDLETVVKKVKDSCVMIYAYAGNKISQGSGFFYDGHIVTAKHIIEGYSKIIVYTDDSIYGTEVKRIPLDTTLDIALLDMDGPTVTLGDSDKLVEGQELVAITSPKGCKNSIDECIYTGAAYDYGKYYMGISESEMEGGSSGGGIFLADSKLIGMNVLGEGHDNAAIPINDLKPILEKLK